MLELSPRARQVLQSSVKRPSLADRERIQGALQARLGVSMLAVGGARAGMPVRARWPFVSSAIVGVGLIGGAFLMPRREPQAAAHVRPSAVPAGPTAASEAPVTEQPAVAPAAAAAELPAALPRPARDRLAQEVAFLERATSALHAGQAASALKVLDEYQHKFPNGLLALDRSAARAQALCSLGRQSDAQAELARLPQHSPAVARAKQVCDASAKAGR
ncbi:MAG: hypothetical protein ABJB12_11300 [Pseudomonadota bacterium]